VPAFARSRSNLKELDTTRNGRAADEAI